jgi:pimeloyl-ACP methyl ester carboxylesterase
MQTLTIQLDTINLSYREWPGDKGPVICLPSLTGHKGAFDRLAELLAPAYHLVALDLRGRGDSDKPVHEYGYAYHAGDILQFADRRGFDTFVIIGHSFGASVAVYLASIRPQRVRAVVILDGGADPKQEVMDAMRPLVRHLTTVYPSMEAYLERMYRLPFYQPRSDTLDKYLREDVENLSGGQVRPKASGRAIEAELNVGVNYSLCLHFPALSCPVLFIRPRQGLLGEQAHIFTEREASAMVAWITNCWRVDLAGVNHYTMLIHDEPPVTPPIRAFLGEVLRDEVTLE